MYPRSPFVTRNVRILLAFLGGWNTIAPGTTAEAWGLTGKIDNIQAPHEFDEGKAWWPYQDKNLNVFVMTADFITMGIFRSFLFVPTLLIDGGITRKGKLRYVDVILSTPGIHYVPGQSFSCCTGCYLVSSQFQQDMLFRTYLLNSPWEIFLS